MSVEPLDHISFSQIDMLSRCGEQWRRRYAEHEIIPPGVALIAGRATHLATSKNLRAKVDTGELLGPDAAADVAADAVRHDWKKGVWLSAEERAGSPHRLCGDTIDKAVRLSMLHAASVAPTLKPTHVEREWAIELPESPMRLVGVIDVQEGNDAVRDMKTARKKPPDTAADDSDQLTVYAMATLVLDVEPVKHVYLDHLVDVTKTKPARVVTQKSQRAREDFPPLLARIEVALNAIRKGVFVPARPTDWWCSPRFCGYFETCPYARNRVTVPA